MMGKGVNQLLLVSNTEQGAQANECGQPLEAEKGKEVSFPRSSGRNTDLTTS